MNRTPLLILFIPLILVILLLQEHLTEPAIEPTGRKVYTVVARDYAVERARSWRYEVEIVCGDSALSGKRAYLYIKKDSTISLPTYRDSLLVRTEWQDGGMIGTFNYGLNLRRKGLIGRGYVRTGQWVIVGHEEHIPVDSKQIQHWLHERLKHLGFEGAELQTLSAMTLGYREDLDNDLRERFQRAGAAHVLAVSGLHTGILFQIIIFLLTMGGLYHPLKDDTVRQWIIGAISMALIWGYALITGMSPSVLRSVIMLTILNIGWLLHRESATLNTLLMAAIVILVIEPRDLWSVSFWLSMSAVAAILLIPNPWKHGGLLWVSLAAQLGTMPISLYVFGQSSNYFLLTNLFAIPLASVVLSGGIASLALGGIPLIGGWIVTLTRWATWLMNTLVGMVESLPGAVTTMQTNMTMTILLYAAIAMSVLSLKKSLWWITGVALAMGAWIYQYITL